MSRYINSIAQRRARRAAYQSERDWLDAIEVEPVPPVWAEPTTPGALPEAERPTAMMVAYQRALAKLDPRYKAELAAPTSQVMSVLAFNALCGAMSA